MNCLFANLLVSFLEKRAVIEGSGVNLGLYPHWEAALAWLKHDFQNVLFPTVTSTTEKRDIFNAKYKLEIKSSSSECSSIR